MKINAEDKQIHRIQKENTEEKKMDVYYTYPWIFFGCETF